MDRFFLFLTYLIALKLVDIVGLSEFPLARVTRQAVDGQEDVRVGSCTVLVTREHLHLVWHFFEANQRPTLLVGGRQLAHNLPVFLVLGEPAVHKEVVIL